MPIGGLRSVLADIGRAARLDLGPDAGAVEHALGPDDRLDVVLFAFGGDVHAEVVCSFRLAEA